MSMQHAYGDMPYHPMRKKLEEMDAIENEHGGKNPDAIIPRLWRRLLTYCERLLGT